jgi:hypothetical protein
MTEIGIFPSRIPTGHDLQGVTEERAYLLLIKALMQASPPLRCRGNCCSRSVSVDDLLDGYFHSFLDNPVHGDLDPLLYDTFHRNFHSLLFLNHKGLGNNQGEEGAAQDDARHKAQQPNQP